MDLAPAELGHQLAVLLGRHGPQNIRKTDGNPPRISVIDVVMAITGQDANHAARDFRRVKEQYPEVNPTWVNFKFSGRGQKNTPVADVRGIVAERAQTNIQQVPFIVVLCLRAPFVAMFAP